MKTQKIKLTQLVEDFALYPRASVDDCHVHQLAEAIEAGASIPPIIVEAKSFRIVDGFHRSRAWRRVHGEDSEIEAIAKTYKSEADLFLEAMRFNSDHGRNMTSYDRTVAIEKALAFAIDPQLVADALHMTVNRVSLFKTERCAKIENSRRFAALKMPIRHKAGQTLTKEQADLIPKFGGNNQTFYVNQLIMLIESDLLDTANESLMERLVKLRDLLNKNQLQAA